MAYTLFIFLPVAICLIWLVIHCVLASKMETFTLIVLLSLSCAVYLFSDACHATQPKGSPLDTSSLIAALFAGPCIIPLIITYLQVLMHRRRRHSLDFMWIIFPTMLFTAGLLTYLLNFEERIGLAFDFIAGPALHSVLAIELVLLLIYCIKVLLVNKTLPGNIFSFIFKGKTISLAKLQMATIVPSLLVMVLRIILTDNLYTVETWVAIVSAAIIATSLFIFATNALFGSQSKLAWKDFQELVKYNQGAGEEKPETRHTGQLPAAEPAFQFAGQKLAIKDESLKGNSLMSQFLTMMTERKLFLQPKLTLDDVADELDSNKTYISRMVNKHYGFGFPELVNIMRVDYAQHYFVSHREAKQRVVARESGFLSASSFNTVFKKVTGMTPKIWLASAGLN